MKQVYCYYRKSLRPIGSPLQSIAYQDEVLYNYCVSKNFRVIKKFSDLGYRRSSLTRPELMQMKRTLDKPKYAADLLVFYSIDAIRKESRNNEVLLQEVVKQIGAIYFFKENITMNDDMFRLYRESLKTKKSPAFKPTLTNYEWIEEA